jgi:serine protease AprX
MAIRRVIAHFAHEYELAEVRKNISEIEATASYVLGHADDDAIEKMREAGAIVEELPIPKVKPLYESAIFATRGGDEETVDVPAHCAISFGYPVTASVEKELEALGVTLLRKIEENRYSAFLTPQQRSAVEGMSSVAAIRTFGSSMTGPESAALEAVPMSIPAGEEAYEIRPDRREDIEALLQWLDENDVPNERHGRVIRIMVPTGSDVPERLRKLELAPVVLPIEPLFDVVLHAPALMEAFVAWLASLNVKIVGRSRKKLRVRIDDPDGAVYESIRGNDAVYSIDPYLPPYVDNDAARLILGVDRKDSDTLVQHIAQTGAGEIVGVADTGVDVDHDDLKNHILHAIARGRANDPSDPHGHGTHVSGSICGDGTKSKGAIRGVAPDAKLVVQSLLDEKFELGGLPLDLNDLLDEAYQLGVRIHNNSWGAAFASHYAAQSEEVDEFVHAHPDMLVVISAGNEGTAAIRENADVGYVELHSIGVPATAKNALTVGASRSDRKDGGYAKFTYRQIWGADFPDPPIGEATISGDPESIAGFSSRGPSTDHRMKPEVVAPGTDILSTRSSKAPSKRFWGVLKDPPGAYAYMGGTSMAAPLVSGCAALVREYYRTQRGHTPSAALLKATIINGTRTLRGDDAIANHPKAPNYHQGFGRVSMPHTIPQNGEFVLAFVDGWSDPNGVLESSGDRQRFAFETTEAGELRVCFTWTDPPGRSLQNVLYVMLETSVQPPQKPTKWQGNEDRPTLLKSLDNDNNTQVIRVANGPAGKYMIQVWNKALLRKPQTFALVVAGKLASDTLSLFHGG